MVALAKAHDQPQAGHLGVVKTYHRLATCYYWRGFYHDVAQYVRVCDIFHRCKVEHLEGEPSLRIINEETVNSSENIMQQINLLTKDELSADIEYEEIHKKLEEASTMEPEEKIKLQEIIWKDKIIFRKIPGRLTSYQHILKVKRKQLFLGRSYPIFIAHGEKVDEEMQRMLNMKVIQKSSSSYINQIVPAIKKDGTVRLCLDARRLNKFCWKTGNAQNRRKYYFKDVRERW